MTLVVCVKTNDGVVLAADSASSMVGVNAQGEQTVYNVYNNANKLFNLVRRDTRCYPVGAVTFGAGSIGQASISTLVKDFRKQIAFPGNPLSVDPESYTIKEVAEKFRDFIFNDKYGSGKVPTVF